MSNQKPEFLETLFGQIESQVQFGDTKASLLVAGDAILLGVSGALTKMVSGCPGETFSIDRLAPSVSLGFTAMGAVLLTLSLVCALLAARPAKVHGQPRQELFLLSYLARMDASEFAKTYMNASSEDLVWEALNAIHGKAAYATKKFRLLTKAIDATLLSLGFSIASLFAAVGSNFLWRLISH